MLKEDTLVDLDIQSLWNFILYERTNKLARYLLKKEENLMVKMKERRFVREKERCY